MWPGRNVSHLALSRTLRVRKAFESRGRAVGKGYSLPQCVVETLGWQAQLGTCTCVGSERHTYLTPKYRLPSVPKTSRRPGVNRALCISRRVLPRRTSGALGSLALAASPQNLNEGYTSHTHKQSRRRRDLRSSPTTQTMPKPGTGHCRRSGTLRRHNFFLTRPTRPCRCGKSNDFPE